MRCLGARGFHFHSHLRSGLHFGFNILGVHCSPTRIAAGESPCGRPAHRALLAHVVRVICAHGLRDGARDVLRAFPPMSDARSIPEARARSRATDRAPFVCTVPAPLLASAGRLQTRACREPRGMGSRRLPLPSIPLGCRSAARYAALPSLYVGSLTRRPLQGHKYIRPKSIHDADTTEEFSKHYMYLACIQFINSVRIHACDHLSSTSTHRVYRSRLHHYVGTLQCSTTSQP